MTPTTIGPDFDPARELHFAMALADMAEAGGDAPEPGESLREAEDEIGIADWIDPETGDPAEGFIRPRLEGG